MCGIVSAIRAHHNVVDFLTDGLKRLEYQGYDSSGIAVNTDGNIRKRVRRVGRVQLMEDAARGLLNGSLGIRAYALGDTAALPERTPTTQRRRYDCGHYWQHHRKL